MKKKQILGSILVLCLAVLAPMKANAQTKVVRTGTRVEMEALETVYARKVNVGNNVRFKVIADVKQDGDVVIPVGSIGNGIVTEAKKSSLVGTKGRLSIKIRSVSLEDGTEIPMTGEIRISGDNRTPLAICIGVITGGWGLLIPGSKAVMPVRHYVDATVSVYTEVPISSRDGQ